MTLSVVSLVLSSVILVFGGFWEYFCLEVTNDFAHNLDLHLNTHRRLGVLHHLPPSVERQLNLHCVFNFSTGCYLIVLELCYFAAVAGLAGQWPRNWTKCASHSWSKKTIHLFKRYECTLRADSRIIDFGPRWWCFWRQFLFISCWGWGSLLTILQYFGSCGRDCVLSWCCFSRSF